ncbi:transposase [Rhodococcus sp. WB9]|uniref:transposase n=1 Tax=Rhodococcus sp. WB9 TaxID=2594007 RepID=UPI0037C6C0BE
MCRFTTHDPPTVQPSILITSREGVSARHPRQQFPDHTRANLCSHSSPPSYFAASAGETPLSNVAPYITNQKQP